MINLFNAGKILTIFIACLTVTPVFAVAVTNMNPSQFENCKAIQTVNNADLDKYLIETDTNIKQIIVDIDKETNAIDKSSVELAKKFNELHKFIDGKDLRQTKSSILSKKQTVLKSNNELRDKLKNIKAQLEQSQQKLAQAYCNVKAHHDYFTELLNKTENKNTAQSINRSITELADKLAKLDVVITDFDTFWGSLNSYTQKIETSVDYLDQFMNSIIAYENNTCQPKGKGNKCTFPAEDMSSLFNEQQELIAINKSFIEARKLLKDKSQKSWKITDSTIQKSN